MARQTMRRMGVAFLQWSPGHHPPGRLRDAQRQARKVLERGYRPRSNSKSGSPEKQLVSGGDVGWPIQAFLTGGPHSEPSTLCAQFGAVTIQLFESVSAASWIRRRGANGSNLPTRIKAGMSVLTGWWTSAAAFRTRQRAQSSV